MFRLESVWWRLKPERLAPAAPDGPALSVASEAGPVQQLAPPNPAVKSQADGVLPSGSWLKSYLIYAVVQALQLDALFNTAPRFFWVDDAARQFGPMAWWLGRNLRGGRPPLMDPDLGMASNLAADMQYGVLDPLHWVFHYMAGSFDDFVALSWVYGSVAVLLLGAGTLSLLLHYRVRPTFAVAGAVGVASSGFFLWYGSSWWPLMWSAAWMTWLWFGLASRRWYGPLIAGLATWAIFASGNPYALPFAVLIVLGQILERRRAPSRLQAVGGGQLLAGLAACAGGVIAALPGLLTTIQVSPLMGREAAERVIGNTGFGVPNLADAVVGGTTLIGHTNSWGGNVPLVPAMATMLLALPLLALVWWRSALRAPGVLTCLVVYVGAIVLTQLPTTVGPFRYPLRYLVNAQIMLPILALVALSAAPRIDRRRLGLAGLILAVQFMLSVFRAPFLSGWHLTALVLGAAALAAAGHLLEGTERGRSVAVAGAAAIVCCVALGPLLAAKMMVSVQERVDDAQDGAARELGLPATARSDWAPDVRRDSPPFRTLYPGYQLGTTVEEYRSRTYAADESLTAVTWDFTDDSGWRAGVVGGNGNLIAGLKPGFGSLAVSHSQLNRHWCRDYIGTTCASPAQLLGNVPGTTQPWIDALSSSTVVLQKTAPPEISQYFEQNWIQARSNENWVEYGRRSPLPGRVAVAQDVAVAGSGWSTQPAYAGRPMDVYTVTTENKTGSLIFRIPYWPGLTATVGGEPVPVSAVDKALLKIDLPRGLSNAELEIFYEPIGAKILIPATVLGVAVILVSPFAIPALAGRRRRRS